MTEAELLKLKNRINQAKTTQAELQGQLKVFTEELKKQYNTTLEESGEVIAQLEEDIEQLEKKMQELELKIKEVL